MALDDAVAAEEARVAADADARKRNREAVDAAALRFAQLAREREFVPSGLSGFGMSGIDVDGWVIQASTVSVFVYADGTWAREQEAKINALRMHTEAGQESTLHSATLELLETQAKLDATKREVTRKTRQAAGLEDRDDGGPVPDAAALEQAMARLLVRGAE